MKFRASTVQFDESLVKMRRDLPEHYSRMQDCISVYFTGVATSREAIAARNAAAATLARLAEHQATLSRTEDKQALFDANLRQAIESLARCEEQPQNRWSIFRARLGKFANKRCPCLRPVTTQPVDPVVSVLGIAVNREDAEEAERGRRKKERRRSKSATTSPAVAEPSDATSSTHLFFSTSSSPTSPDAALSDEILKVTIKGNATLPNHLEYLRVAALAIGQELDVQNEILDALYTDMTLEPLHEAMSIAERLINTGGPKIMAPILE